MKAPNPLRTLSINLSLVILALGFSTLGFFSVMNTQPNLSTGILSVEHAYSLIGSIFSVLVGATFLVAAGSGLVAARCGSAIAGDGALVGMAALLATGAATGGSR